MVIPNGVGTEDMPELWGNTNLVNLVRDMLIREEGNTLQLLSGVLPEWIGVSETISGQGAPTTPGGSVASFRLTYPEEGKTVLTVTPPTQWASVTVRFRIGEGRAIKSVYVSGQTGKNPSRSSATVKALGRPAEIAVQF